MTDLIRDMPMDDRPREKLLERGAGELSNSDLLAILLGSGTRGANAMQVARQLLRDGVDNLARQDVSQLARVRGVGLAKATRIAASFELARRCRRPTRRAFELNEFGEKLVASWGHHRQERLGAALLDGRHQVFRQRLIFVGTVNYTIVSTRDILQFAILQQATAVVVYHNHPSGNTGPSPEDVEFTKKLDEALKLVDIELRDHLIIGAHTFSSMKQKHYF